MPENTKEKEAPAVAKKKGVNPLVAVGIGCFVLLFLVGTAISIGMKFFAKKAGTSLLQGFIENKTGVKTNLGDIEKGKVTFTDPKTGQTVNVGGETLPETFPKDFPVYKGAKVVGSVSNTQAGTGNGFLVTFTTTDSLDKVVAFYKSGLTASGWDTTSAFNSDAVQTWSITKGTQEGGVTISADNETTSILVTLGEKEAPTGSGE